MSINAGVVDQRLISLKDGLRTKAAEELNIHDENKLTSLAFVFLCVKTLLDLNDDEAFDCLTEGGQDFGIDALHLIEECDGEFTVCLFQSKYKQNLEANANFPETAIKNLIHAIRHIFNPRSELQNINIILRAKVEAVRSLIRDGYIPLVRVFCCNNGQKWNNVAQEEIERENFGDQVSWEYVNPDRILKILQAIKPVTHTVQLIGKASIEDFNFSRVLIGKMRVSEISNLIRKHGEKLLERNIRRYLGLQGNRVNQAIKETLKSNEPANFYFYNNGITITCDKFSYNNLQNGDYQVKLDNLQIINGGQTCMTIYKTLDEPNDENSFLNTYVLVRIYQLPSENENLVKEITFATNSQNPVELKDLRSNDETQRRLETDIEQLGYTYKRKRSDSATKSTDITIGVAAEAVLSVWRKKPQQAKFFLREHFGKLYETIFSDELNGAQVVIATLLYRLAETKRKKLPDAAPPFIRYASCFIAMQMGQYLLNDLRCPVKNLDHRNFQQAKTITENRGEDFYNRAVNDIRESLTKLYGSSEVSIQQLSATFRRGDLIEKLVSNS